MTATAVASREQSRRADGKFGMQQHGTQDDLVADTHYLDEQAEEIIQQARKSARHFTSSWGRYGADQADDIAGEAIVNYLEAEANRRAAGGPTGVRSPRAYLHTVVRHQAANTLNQRTNGRDVTALAKLNEHVHKRQAELGRSLTDHEYVQLAGEVRHAMDPRNRPSADYHRSRFSIPIDESFERAHPQADTRDRSEPFEVGSHGHRAFEQNAARTQGGIAKAKRSAFLAVAERSGAPAPAERKHSMEKASKLRDARAAAGGVMAMVRRFEDGEDPDPLFAPFEDDLGPKDRQAVADMFSDHPNYADDLWTSALQIATKYRKAAT